MSRLKHSKYKNTGFIYEALIKKLILETIEQNKTPKSLKLIYKYFNDNNILKKQYNIYQHLIQSKNLDIQSANLLIQQIQKQYKKFYTYNKNIINKNKYNLIKQIKELYGDQDEIFNIDNKNYKLLASIYKIFQADISNKNYNPIDIVQSKKLILQNLIINEKYNDQGDDITNQIKQYKQQQIQLKNITYKLLIQKFNKKYNKQLNNKQKIILKEYINNINNKHTFLNFSQQLIKNNIKLLSEMDIKQNKILNIKVESVIKALNDFNNKIQKTNLLQNKNIIALLQVEQLIQELINNEKVLVN